jgi:hypothetical protein
MLEMGQVNLAEGGAKTVFLRNVPDGRALQGNVGEVQKPRDQ